MSARNAGRSAVPGRAPALIVLALALVAALCAVLLVRDALAARDAMALLAERVPAVEQTLRARMAGTPGDDDDAGVAELQALADDAVASTDGPLWWAAARLPVVGPNAEAAATVAHVLDDLVDVVVPALTQGADAVAESTRSPDGGIDLGPLRAASPALARSAATLDADLARLAAIDPRRLRPELAEPVVSLHARLGELAGAVATADRAAALLPPMLGADGPRTYLLLAVNNAELRAGGGIAGALVLLRVEAGRVEILRQVGAPAVGPFPEPVLPLHPDDVAVHSERLGTFVQDVTATPDFPTTARLAAEMWARSEGERVDGVLATDPVALSFLLSATGPIDIELPAGLAPSVGARSIQVTAENVVDLLLRRAYALLEPEQADAFYATVASAVLDRLTAGEVTAGTLLPALQQAAEEHRLLAWSARPEEEERLAGTVLAGTFTDAPRAADAVGVFLEDTVAGKMSAYLDAGLAVAGSRCTPSSRVDTLELRLASTAPADAATSLPWYVAGLPGGADPPGTLSLTVRVEGPRDGEPPRLERDGAPFGGEVTTAHGRPVASATVALAPGESTTLRLEVPSTHAAARGEGAGRPGTLEVWSTPTTTSGGLLTAGVPVCG